VQELLRLNEELNLQVKERTRELREKNEKLRESNQIKEMLLSAISHDIRSPFNYLLGFISLLKNGYEDLPKESIKSFIDLIEESTNNLYNLADNLLMWSDTEQNRITFDPGPVSLNSVVKQCYAPFENAFEKKGLQFVNNVDKDLYVFSDPNVLAVILRNLVSNSYKFTKSGGTVVVSAEQAEDSDAVIISVEDTGVGMAKEKADSLFRSRVNNSTWGTDHEKGTGIGLALCKSFIDLHDTDIWVESEPGKGTKVSFSLPRGMQQEAVA
jgi:signal transduction histidine kinase